MGVLVLVLQMSFDMLERELCQVMIIGSSRAASAVLAVSHRTVDVENISCNMRMKGVRADCALSCHIVLFLSSVVC